jgi:hypothetical protein
MALTPLLSWMEATGCVATTKLVSKKYEDVLNCFFYLICSRIFFNISSSAAPPIPLYRRKLGSKVDEGPNVRSSDTDTYLPIVLYRPIFSRIIDPTQLLHPKRRILKQHNHFIASKWRF